MAAVKDSHIVIRFMALYMRLRDSIDDDPESLLILSMGDDILHSLCSDLHFLAFEIQTAERRTRKLFANPVDPKFVEAWRDYEARYSHVLGVIELADLLGVDVNAICPPQQPGGEIEPRHQFAAEEARKSAATITNIFAFAEQQIEFEREWLDETTSEEVDRGISEWESLERNASFDLEGILRRRMLTPFVLIPRHVSSGANATDGTANKPAFPRVSTVS